MKKIISDREIKIHWRIDPDLPYEKKEYFLISLLWCKKAFGFLDEITYNKSTCNMNDLFEIKKFFKKFSIFNNTSKIQDDIYHTYPGPVNNFDLINFKDFWFDNNNKNYLYSNTFLSKKILEYKDYLLLNKYEWDLIIETFGYLYEIKRFRLNNKSQIEIYPLEVNNI